MIENEMSDLKPDNHTPLYYEIGIFNPIIRVNLARCKAEHITSSQIASAFYQGSKVLTQKFEGFKRNSKKNFEDLVSFMIETIYNTPFCISKHTTINFLDNIKKNNFPAVHYSKIYKELYQPHYRIIPKDIWIETIQKI
ncbi:MAG: hypothetical protein K9W44_10940 [Candidatus Lokiarchaeota archaeon]|nr:hypothetical protein [Candidatus Harpocratesius repetitus]